METITTRRSKHKVKLSRMTLRVLASPDLNGGLSPLEIVLTGGSNNTCNPTKDPKQPATPDQPVPQPQPGGGQAW